MTEIKNLFLNYQTSLKTFPKFQNTTTMEMSSVAIDGHPRPEPSIHTQHSSMASVGIGGFMGESK